MFALQNGRRKYVLRKKPPGEVLASAHAVEREYQVRLFRGRRVRTSTASNLAIVTASLTSDHRAKTAYLAGCMPW